MMDAILDDPVLNAMPLEHQAVYFRLLATLSRAGSRDGSIELSNSGACALTGRKRLDSALIAVRYQVHSGLVSGCYDPGKVLLRVSNWPKIQGFTPALRVEERRVEKSREETPSISPPAKPKKTASKAQKVPCPAPSDWADEARDRILKATGCNTSELRAGIEAVHNWSEEKDMRRTLRGWEATARRAVKERWGKKAGNGAARGRRRDPESNYTPPPVSKNWPLA
jgi:hypothetical protein